NPATTILPILAYRRLPEWGVAVTAGTAFNPATTNYPAQYRNKFFFADWGDGGWIRFFDMNNPAGFDMTDLHSADKELAASGFVKILGLTTGIDGNIITLIIMVKVSGELNRI
ncbi:MAG: hypothetical protein H7259_07855, partial [Cytophagales bacterium]|nr:hypothetical protein [Cytophaga sp.]